MLHIDVRRMECVEGVCGGCVLHIGVRRMEGWSVWRVCVTY